MISTHNTFYNTPLFLSQWLRDNLQIIASAKDGETLAATVKDNGGVYFVPAFSGLYAPYWRDGRMHDRSTYIFDLIPLLSIHPIPFFLFPHCVFPSYRQGAI